jgi:hypothetical protein
MHDMPRFISEVIHPPRPPVGQALPRQMGRSGYGIMPLAPAQHANSTMIDSDISISFPSSPCTFPISHFP